MSENRSGQRLTSEIKPLELVYACGRCSDVWGSQVRLELLPGVVVDVEPAQDIGHSPAGRFLDTAELKDQLKQVGMAEMKAQWLRLQHRKRDRDLVQHRDGLCFQKSKVERV